MNDKHGMLFLGAGMAVILGISLIVALDGTHDSNRGTVIYITPPQESAQAKEDSSATTIITSTLNTAETPETKPTAEEYIYININTADVQELMKLSGIGEHLAQAIAEHRNTYGAFANIGEIMLVDGIGEGIFNDICNNIYVENPVYTKPPVPTETTTAEITTEPQLTLEDIAPIDLNTATAEELMLLPHVTEEIACKIIELRSEIQYFSHVYELLYVEELEQNQVSDILDFVTVGQ